VEKVEKVLAAEEKARHTLADARERAASVRASADVAARKAVADSSAKATDDAQAAREKAISAAREEAAKLEARASKELEAQVTAARARIDVVATKLAATLRG
jgi:vacuolar-type H+-ATPase subunit H